MRASKNPSNQLAVNELIERINAESEKQLADMLTPDQQAQLKNELLEDVGGIAGPSK
jgi:hypothetical protein